MPQFDTSTFAPQLVWLTITFLALYVAMAKVALPRIGGVLEERQRRIDENLKKAEALKADADAAAREYERLLAEARASAGEAVLEVRQSAAAESAKRQAELGDRLTKEVKDAEARIAKARESAIAGLREVAVEVAGMAVERLIGEKADGKALGGAVDDAMKERA